MHELSIAQEIVNIVEQYLPPHQNGVKTVKVRIGKLSSVLPDSLQFCFDAVIQDTPLKGARLEIDHISIEIECRSCFNVSRFDDINFYCPHCGSPEVKLLSGSELQVAEIELRDEIEEEK